MLMMVTCYTLARVQPAMTAKVYRAVKEFQEVKEAIITYGEYDLILKIEKETIEDLDNFIFNKLRSTEGMSATTTLIAAKPPNIAEE
jgi:anthranilate phosphoribosyltransferase